MRFEGYRVLVTGGTRGIGRAVCEAFAVQGATVAVHGSGRDGVPAVDHLPGDGHVGLTGDVSDPDVARDVVDDADAALGGLDVLVNNAGVFLQLDPRTASYEDWQEHWRTTLAVDLLGPAWLSFCAIPALRASGRGRIVNVGSRGASRGEPQAVAYGAAKAGLTAMGQSLALACARDGIAVGTVLPGFVETEMARAVLDGPGGDAVRAQSPTGRVGRPEEVAAAVLSLAAPDAFWSTGAVLDVNGASYLRS